MRYMIRELRDMTGLTQKAFAERYEIPLSTLRKWEQGEAAPASYVVRLIADTIPAVQEQGRVIRGQKGTYRYDETRNTVSDSLGNEIRISEKLKEVKDRNLAIYLDDLFEDYHHIKEKFERDCRLDREEDILWSRPRG